MATAKTFNIKVPTPKQSPFTKTSLDYSPFETTPYFKPGHVNEVPNVFKLHWVYISLTTSADAGNRTMIPAIQLYDSVNDSTGTIFSATTGNIAASQLGKVVLGPVDTNTLDGLTYNPAANVMGIFQLPRGCILSGYDCIIPVVSGVFANDVQRIIIVAEYLNHRLGITEGF